jgi:hypothetical protein
MRPQAYTYQEFMNKSNLQCSLVLRAAAYQSNSVNKGCFTPSSLHPLPPLPPSLPLLPHILSISVVRSISLTRVLCHRDNCARVLTQVRRPQLRETKFTHDNTQVQELLAGLTERHTLFHRLPADWPANSLFIIMT